MGDKPLLIKDFQKRLTESQRLMKRQNPGITDEMLEKGGFKWQVYDEMVLLELVQMEAQRLGVSVSKEEMVREIARVPAFQDENGKFDLEGRYNKILEANSIAPAEFERRLPSESAFGKDGRLHRAASLHQPDRSTQHLPIRQRAGQGGLPAFLFC